MLGKLLLTLLVIAVALVFLRERKQASQRQIDNSGTSSGQSQVVSDKPEGSNLRTAAYMFLVLMIGVASLLYFLQWQDDHVLLTVTLYNNTGAAPVTYQVYQYQMSSRSFVTIDGIQITVADSERMEVTGLP